MFDYFLDRTWMYEVRTGRKGSVKEHFYNGVHEFIKFAKSNSGTDKEIRCPCNKCKLLKHMEPDIVEVHLYKYGFVPKYELWDRRGELVAPNPVCNSFIRSNKLKMAPKKPISVISSNESGKCHSMCLKLLIDQKSKQVIFAEAGKDTVDFLFTLLQMPVGSIIQLLSTTNMVGSIGNIFQSICDLDDKYIHSYDNMDAILNSCNANVGLLTNGEDSKPTEPEIAKKIYTCTYFHYYSECYKAICSSCKGSMMYEKTRNPSDNQSDNVVASVGMKAGLGIVKELVTYMVMDDLTIMPMSTVSGLTQLSKLGVKDTGMLEEQVVSIGMEQGLALLKASFESKTVLTDVFLCNKKAKKKL